MSKKSFINYFNELVYYNVFDKYHIPKVDNITELLRSEEKCKKFICKFFKIDEKESFFENKYPRSRHTVLSFLIGFLFSINYNLDSKINAFFAPLVNKLNKKIDFVYLLFLATLLHDLAYIYEKDKDINLKMFNNDEIFEKETFTYDYFLYQYYRSNHRYNFNIYNRYYEYTIVYERKKDHGIIGGKLLYRNLKNNLINAYIKEKNDCENIKITNFDHNDLYFSINQLDLFREIAFIIMDHNIWPIKNEKVAKQFALNEINKDHFNKISISENPILFLLCLIDAIEPFNILEVDKFSIEHVIYALNNAFVEVGDNILVIYIFKLNYLNCIDKWKENLKAVVDLLDVSIEEEYNNKIVIKW